MADYNLQNCHKNRDLNIYFQMLGNPQHILGLMNLLNL